MQAGSGASPSPRQSVFLHEVLLCVCLCVCMQQKDSLTHTHQTKPRFAHPQSRDFLFVSRAIPLLASKAFLLLYPYITIALRGSCLFHFLLFLGNRMVHDWSCLRVLGVFGGGVNCSWDISAYWVYSGKGWDAYVYVCILKHQLLLPSSWGWIKFNSREALPACYVLLPPLRDLYGK